MQSNPVLEFDALLAPIPGDSPTGVYLRKDPNGEAIYHDIKSVRNSAREAEDVVPDDESPEPPPSPNEKWRQVKELCISALTERTKDLDIAAYLIEALLRTDGAAGLRDGFHLVRELGDRYWDGLYPPIDGDDGVFGRVAVLSNLNGSTTSEGSLVRAMDRIALAYPGSSDEKTFLDYHYAQAKLTPKANRQGESPPPRPEFMEALEVAIAGTDIKYFQTTVGDMEAALQQLQEMGRSLDRHAGRDSPSTTKIREKLDFCLNTIRSLVGPRLAEAEADSRARDTVTDPTTTTGTGPGGPGVAVGPVRSREDAFKTLLEVAAFFEKTEPHSPVGQALRRVVKLGRMSFVDLMREGLPEESSRNAALLLFGIKEESPGS